MPRYASRFQTQTPWTPLPYSPLHETVWQFLCTASLVFGTWYLGWRWLGSMNYDALWFSIPLLIAETGSFIGLVLFTANLWSAKSPTRGALPVSVRDCTDDPDMPDRPVAVDVFFATYSEDPELVRVGLQEAKKLRYPHPITVQVHVLDDGKRPAMEAVAREEGVNYITRSDNVGFKAGNLRNAMTSTSGDFILICDADMHPFPTFLEETLGYFRDPKVAWVQTPHWFYDIPRGAAARSAWETPGSLGTRHRQGIRAGLRAGAARRRPLRQRPAAVLRRNPEAQELGQCELLLRRGLDSPPRGRDGGGAAAMVGSCGGGGRTQRKSCPSNHRRASHHGLDQRRDALAERAGRGVPAL
ncbi:glycosyltransferase [Microvirga aerilata]|uniref:glycosyltransferase n=1 Tax=Microvirga aerilata TaxID=670292 RepID=UPI0036406E10